MFAIVIETMAIAICDNPDIKGPICGACEHKFALFVDNVLLFITSPLTSLPSVLRILQDIGGISGLKSKRNKVISL